jgi:hypothetical protein
MDPTVCYRDMLTSLQDGDNEAAREHALNLQGWLNRGGFCPHGQNIITVKAELAQVLCMTATLLSE